MTVRAMVTVRCQSVEASCTFRPVVLQHAESATQSAPIRRQHANNKPSVAPGGAPTQEAESELMEAHCPLQSRAHIAEVQCLHNRQRHSCNILVYC